MFENKSKIVTLETLTTLCEKELKNFKNSELPQVKINDTKIKKIDIKQPGEDILWL